MVVTRYYPVGGDPLGKWCMSYNLNPNPKPYTLHPNLCPSVHERPVEKVSVVGDYDLRPQLLDVAEKASDDVFLVLLVENVERSRERRFRGILEVLRVASCARELACCWEGERSGKSGEGGDHDQLMIHVVRRYVRPALQKTECPDLHTG